MSAPTAPVAASLAPPAAPVPQRLTFVRPLPGLPAHTDFRVEPLDDRGLGFVIRAVDDGDVRLFLASTGVLFPDYAPRLPADVDELLGAPVSELVLLAVVHPAGDDRARPTANLLAPVVVAPGSGRAAQVILDGDLPLRIPLG